jgi:hypothetical protein
MTMTRGVTEIDRLIEQGLTLYGEGDLDAALLLWERVLVIDPENPQASSYVEYVRTNYQLLAGDGNTEDSGPYAIGDDEPEYQIEIVSGDDLEPADGTARAAEFSAEGSRGGWMIGDEGDKGGKAGKGTGAGAGKDQPPRRDPLLLELDEEAPPSEPTFESAKTGETVSFEDATREYPGGAGRPAVALLGDANAGESGDFGIEITPGFGGPEDVRTPQDFGAQTTDVRRRDLGFVQPTDSGQKPTGPPELKMTLRTPVSQTISLPPESELTDDAADADAGDVHRAPTADGDDDAAPPADGDPKLTLDLALSPGPGLASALDSLDLDLSSMSDAEAAAQTARGTADLPGEPLSIGADLFGDAGVDPGLVGRADTRPALADAAGEAVDLIASLPTPRAPSAPTKPLPGHTRPPATERIDPGFGRRPDSKAPAGNVATAPTQEIPFMRQLDPLRAQAEAQLSGATRDFSEKPTNEIRKPASSTADPVISAPTRELGLRSARLSTDDETTGQVDIHRLRTARSSSKPDIVPVMDPIDARSAEILEEIDRARPEIETREERTRRRITALLERATAWGRDVDLERAVTAVDLALSEDPTSALAQKLVHRNRETIMNVFQAFLGDLQRTPSLARPLHELGSAPISPRAAFLLSRVDGTLSLDEILDVSGMPRLEAYRYLCQLFLRGILR